LVHHELEPGGFAEDPGWLVAGGDDYLCSREQTAFPRCSHNIQDVRQQRLAPVRRLQLAAAKSPPLARGEDKATNLRILSRAGCCSRAAYPARSSAVSSARRVITVAR
jgi:hypothetical protein